MSPNIFITGATGYVGGDFLHLLLKTHPSWAATTTCLVRSASRGSTLTDAHPDTKVLHGTLDDSQTIEDAASKADIVLHFASCDHVPSAEAIKRGLEKGKGGVWIHTSGTDVTLPTGPEKDKILKEGKVYDDWEGIEECLTFPDTNAHRPVDKIVLSTASPIIKTAIICPCTIVGPGRGAVTKQSNQIPTIARCTLQRGSGILIPTAHPSKTLFWRNINVRDLSRVYLHLIDEIDTGGEEKATWNEMGYYFIETERHDWQDVSNWIAEEAARLGYIESKEVKAMTEGDVNLTNQVGPALSNYSVSYKGTRVRKLLDWEPEIIGGIRGEIADIVKAEADKLGLKSKF